MSTHTRKAVAETAYFDYATVKILVGAGKRGKGKKKKDALSAGAPTSVQAHHSNSTLKKKLKRTELELP